jgi:formamidopyrimidine-DNA glycosylase
MPELPEVETIARDLRGLVVGSWIVGARSNWPPTLRSHAPDAFAAEIAGRRIEGIGRRGKQLLVWLGPRAPESAVSAGSTASESVDGPDPHPGSGPAVLTLHLKMTGQLFVVPAATPADRHVHLTLALADGREIRFRDMRKFGRIGLYGRDASTGLPLEGEARGVLATGAEPLADEFTTRRFADMVAHRRGRLKTLLLNQDFVAGVGNIYADEALWRARLHPLRDAHTLRPGEARRLHEALRGVLAEAVERRGSSVDDYTAPEGDGSMQEHLAVYQRAGEPCSRCGRTIRRIVVSGRSTHFCGWCQRLPAGERQAATSLLSAEKRSGRPARGPRWTELGGEGSLGRTRAEEAEIRRVSAKRAAEARAAERRRRVVAARAAAATRRAAARSAAAATTASATTAPATAAPGTDTSATARAGGPA